MSFSCRLNSNGPPKDVGNSELSSELDANNPVVVCDPRITQEDVYQIDGVTDSNGYLNDPRVVHKQTNTTYDSDNQGTSATGGYDYGNVSRTDVTGNDVGGQHFVSGTTYYPNDNLGSGVYLTDLPAKTFTLDANGNTYTCAASIYGNNTAVSQAPSVTQDSSTIAYLNNGSCSGTAATVTNGYDASGNPLSDIDADGHLGCSIGNNTYTMCATYDSAATHMLSATNTKNQTASSTYDPTAAGGFGQWETSMTNVNGRTNTYQYDALGRITALFQIGDNASSPSTTYTYINTCTAGQTTPCTEIDTRTRINESGNVAISKAYYNGMGELVETVKPGPTQFSKIPAVGSLLVSYTVYDAMGRATIASQPYAVANSSGKPGGSSYLPPDLTQARTVTRYDGAGRSLGTVTYSNTSTIVLSTNIAYGVTQGVPNTNVDTTSAFAYVTTTDAYQHQSTGFLDALARTRYTQTYQGTGTASSPYTVLKTIQSNYDPVGDEISTLTFDSAGKQLAYHTTTYDGIKRATGSNDADSGSCLNSPLPPSCSSNADTAWKQSYDANSNVLSSTDPRGVTTYSSYDSLNRPLCSGTTSAAVNPCQNSATDLMFYDSYDNSSNPTATFPSGCSAPDSSTPSFATEASVAEVFNGSAGSGWRCVGFDQRGQTIANPLSVTADSHTTTQTVTMGYNNAGTLNSLTYPDGEIVAQSYDDNGYFRGSSSGNGPLASNVQYTKSGQLSSMTLGGIIAAGTATTPVQTSMTYDGIQRAISTSATVSSHTIFSQARTYDNVGNVLQLQTVVPTTSGGSQTDAQSFCYDSQNQLVWAGNTGTPSGGDHCGTTPTGSTLATYQQSLSYDAMGRLIAGPNGTTTYDTSHVDAATSLSHVPNQYASYDAMGNMTCRNVDTTAAHSCDSTQTGATMTYDDKGQLQSWTAPSGTNETDQFLYDGAGSRVLQRAADSSGTTDTITFDGYTEVTIHNSTTSTIKYYSAAGKDIAMNKDGAFSYLLNDFLNSSSVTLNGNGTAQSVQLFAPYGSTRYSDGTSPTTYNFTGQRLDSITGLLYYNARYYDAFSGRFTSSDSVEGNAQGMDSYAYVRGNPETATDPTGHRFAIMDNGGNTVLSAPFSAQMPTAPTYAPSASAWGGYYGNYSGGYTHHATTSHATKSVHKTQSSGGSRSHPSTSSNTHTTANQILKKAGQVVYQAVDSFFGISSMVGDVGVLTDSHTSWWDKVKAGGDLAMNIGMDASMFTGAGEELRGGELLAKGSEELLDHGGEDALDKGAEEIGKGYSVEVKSSKPVRAKDATNMWEDFLGEGPYTDTHPRTGLPDPDRIVSADGTRSVRFGAHEMESSATKLHFHLETWTYDAVRNVMNYDNLLVRVAK